MKKILCFGLIIWLIASACSRQKNDPLLGAWKMIQMQQVEGKKITNYFSDRYNVSQTKMWSEGHFIFVGKYEVDTTVTYRYGTGTYTLNGNIYEETIKYHFVESYEGQKNKIWLEIRNDTLLHIFPINDLGQPNQTRHWIEKYVRLK